MLTKAVDHNPEGLGAKKTIGLLLPRLNAGYDLDVLTGAHAVARQRGIRLIAFWGTPGDILGPGLARDQIDGWVAVLNIPNPEGIRDLAQSQRPMVIIGALVPDLICPQVLPDNRGGVHAAVRHLIDHGHRRIAFVGDLRIDDIRERYEGYRAALTERGLPLDPGLVFGSVEYHGHGPQGFGGFVVQQIIERNFPCSAAFAANDICAFEMLQATKAAGYHVPQNLAVVGFDDLVEAQHTTPPLTTVRQSYPALGRLAAELLLAQLDGQAVSPGPAYAPTALMVRRSCGCTSGSAVSVSTLEDRYTATGWQERLAQDLVQMALHPLPPDPATPATHIWPGVVVLLDGLAATTIGTTPPAVDDLARAWEQALTLTTNIEILHALLDRLQQAGIQRLAAAEDPSAARARLQVFLDAARLELARAGQSHNLARVKVYENLMQANYAVSMALLKQEGGSAARLAWMRQTPLSWGCLGLWSDTPPTLVVSGTYRRDSGAAVPVGAHYTAATFPPLDNTPTAAQADGPEVVMLLPVRTATRDWGMLAVCGLFTSRATQSSDADVRLWATLLGAALERESLLGSLADAESTLRVAYEQRLLTENIHDLIFVLDHLGHYLYASPSFQQVLGYRPQALLGGSVFDLVHPDDLATVREQWTYIITPGMSQATFRARHADGSWRWLETSGTVIVQGDPSIVLVGRDITERKRAEMALTAERNLLRTLIDTLPDEIYIKDAHSRFLNANTTVARSQGVSTPEELIGKTDFDLMPYEEAAKHYRAEQAILQSGQPMINQENFDREKTLWRLETKVPLRDGQGQIVGLVGINRFITERKRAEEEIRQLNAELERRVLARTAELAAANQELEAFSYSISHDLRAPLRAIDGFSRILLQEHTAQLDPQARRYFQRIRDAAQRMGQLIDDLLKFSRLSRQPLNKRPVRVADMIREMLDELRPDYEPRRVEFILGELPACQADPAMLRQVWVNLLSNALKYTRDREVARIEIGAQNSGGELTYFIQDNGVGFDMGTAQKLFGVFQRLHKPEEFEGTGVGLAIVQRIIHRHGGRVWAQAAVGQGSTFYFSLPTG
jgi:PAS domain S-box-containing protein